MMMKTLCAGLLVAMTATTFGCGSAASPTAPAPQQESAMVDDQAQPAEVAAVQEQAQQPTYSTQAVLVRRGYGRIYARPHVYARPIYRHPHVYVRPYPHVYVRPYPHVYVRPIYRHPRVYVRPIYRHPRVYVRPYRRY